MQDMTFLQSMVEEAIRRHSNLWDHSVPANLYLPVSYSLQAGGKRLRPLLLLTGYQLFGDQPGEALPAALAIEIFHNFTLLHDDIMDKAEVRRNRPAVHKQFGENSAILSGDAMAFLAYRFLLQCQSDKSAAILSLFTETAIEVCEGQQLDMDFETTFDVTPGLYLEMIRLKSAVLLACALKTGGWLGGCSDEDARLLYDAGICLGMGFQLQDDLLDTFGSEQILGKKTGGDITANKKTFLLIQALLQADVRQKEELLFWFGQTGSGREEKIRAVRRIFSELNVKELSEQKVREYYDKATMLIGSLNVDQFRKEPLLLLFKTLDGRKN